LIFGEALFDHFPDGNKVLGGAPFNVAWHLQGFKTNPLMVTAVGGDPEGEEILRRMAEWGMSTAGVQIHPHRPTGRVTAHLEGGEPRYEIEAHQAYDTISLTDLSPLSTLGEVHLLYHGSLGIREERSRTTLSVLRGTLKVPTLLDVNLRNPWWDLHTVHGLLRGTEWVKMNQAELGLLSEDSLRDGGEIPATAEALRQRYRIGTLVVTLGDKGAMAVSREGVRHQDSPHVGNLVDPVGAGDAFSAVLALGIRGGWSLETILSRATQFAAELCRVRGATLDDPEIYTRHLRRWDHAP